MKFTRFKRFKKPTITLLAGFAAIYLILALSPYPELRQFRNRPVSVRYYDVNDTLLQILAANNDGLRREYTPYRQLDRELIRLFITSEDRRFYFHNGIDLLAVARAIQSNQSSGRQVSGASTITMQLARMISPHEGGMRGKLLEAFNALRLEARLSKRTILELYLNNLPFSFNTEGVTSAARYFFGSNLNDLNLSQKLSLVIIPRRPQLYNPHLNNMATARQSFLLAERLGYNLTEQQIAEALTNSQSFTYPFLMPHYINYLQTQRGPRTYERRLAADLDFYNYLERRMQFYLQGQEQYRLNAGAMVVFDNRSGQILAYIGSPNFFDDVILGQIDGVQIRREPGSTLKPFLYTLGLERGFEANDILPDIPTEFGTGAVGAVYIPRNFNERFNGPVRYREALASSLNIPAVYLLERLGVQNFTDYLLDFGFNSLSTQRGDLGLSLALGGANVSLFELTRAFSALANEGQLFRVQSDRNTRPQFIRVTSQKSAVLMASILSDRAARRRGFGDGVFFDTPFEAIFKTGTSNQFQNIWALGATPHYTVGVWMGNFRNETVIARTGSGLPAALVRDTLIYLQGANEVHPTFQSPANFYKVVEICALSGMAATPYCPFTLSEYVSFNQHLQPCNWHQADGSILYPEEYSHYLSLFNRYEQVSSQPSRLRFLTPNDGAVFFIDDRISSNNQALRIEIAGGNDSETFLWINDRRVAHFYGPPYRYHLPLARGNYWLEAENGGERAFLQIEVR